MPDQEDRFYSGDSDFGLLLIKRYGTQIEKHLNEIKEKLDIIVAGHLFAGTSGDNPLAIINRELKRLMLEEN